MSHEMVIAAVLRHAFAQTTFQEAQKSYEIEGGSGLAVMCEILDTI